MKNLGSGHEFTLENEPVGGEIERAIRAAIAVLDATVGEITDSLEDRRAAVAELAVVVPNIASLLGERVGAKFPAVGEAARRAAGK